MTLKHFLDTAYALIIEEFQRVGVPLEEAMYKTRNLGKPEDPERPEKPPQVVQSQNDQSMALLKAQMAGLG